jgi:hypothetical protein
MQAINVMCQNSTSYYSLHDDCEGITGDCWKLDLCWNEELENYSTVHQSEMAFRYFPKKKAQCSSVITYRLVPLKGSGNFVTWQYQNANITIRVKMRMVETAFGFQLYDVRLTNKHLNDCQPKTFVWKH